MKHIFYSILFLTVFLSCKNTTSANLTQEDAGALAAPPKDNFIYQEVTGLKKSSDYTTANKVQKLNIQYGALSFNISYISDRAYIAITNGNNTATNWTPVHINFYYDLSFSDAENDMHLLLKDNDVSKGYILFPAFTEEFASYFVYYFEKNSLSYLGNYQASAFGKGTFSFNEQTKELFRSSDKNSKLTKVAEPENNNFVEVGSDLKLLKEYSGSLNGDQLKTTTVNKEWLGAYNGSFLRLKDESADPRAWGQINMEIGKETGKFKLDSYNEQVEKELKVVYADARKIQFADKDNDQQRLTILLDKNTYKLSGTLIEKIVGARETYELKKQ